MQLDKPCACKSPNNWVIISLMEPHIIQNMTTIKPWQDWKRNRIINIHWQATKNEKNENLNSVGIYFSYGLRHLSYPWQWIGRVWCCHTKQCLQRETNCKLQSLPLVTNHSCRRHFISPRAIPSYALQPWSYH